MRLLHHTDQKINFIYSVDQAETPYFKPNGLWVSVDGEYDWLSWCKDAGYGSGNYKYNYEIVFQESAKILYLCSSDDIDDFHEKYKTPLFPDTDNPQIFYIDWEKVAEDYQGIIISPYIWGRRLEGEASDWYYSWDCASGCIWNFESIKSYNEIKEVAK